MSEGSQANIGAVVLAAGGSTRMGQPKQLLKYHGVSLLRRAVDTVLATTFRPVVVVLGASADACRTELTGLDVIVVENSNWHAGMGGSIRLGIEALQKTNSEGALVFLHDQPLITANDLAGLGDIWQCGDPGKIAVSRYCDTLGTPIIIGRCWWDELKMLPPSAGAKRLINHHPDCCVVMDLPVAARDIDTPGDYDDLCKE